MALSMFSGTADLKAFYKQESLDNRIDILEANRLQAYTDPLGYNNKVSAQRKANHDAASDIFESAFKKYYTNSKYPENEAKRLALQAARTYQAELDRETNSLYPPSFDAAALSKFATRELSQNITPLVGDSVRRPRRSSRKKRAKRGGK
jgi:hypothetical protein